MRALQVPLENVQRLRPLLGLLDIPSSYDRAEGQGTVSGHSIGSERDRDTSGWASGPVTLGTSGLWGLQR